MLEHLPPWEALMKRMVWQQLGKFQNQKMLDFGSGHGTTANYYARCNEVTAIEPSVEMAEQKEQTYPYRQLIGSTDQLRKLPDETFDVILCHNVLEYTQDPKDIVNEFARLLKPNGLLSIVKHNRAGRVMQMVVLLNSFDKAHELLDGKDGSASRYGTIHYYEEADIEKWCSQLQIANIFGVRTFWDLQQNQEIHKDPEWQQKMLEMEMRVSGLREYRAVAFFHHLLIRKK